MCPRIVLIVLLALLMVVPTQLSSATTAPQHPARPLTLNAGPGWATICNGCTDDNSPTGASLMGREYGAMAFDTADHYVVLFGGEVSANANLDGSTWVYSSKVWHQLATQDGNGQCIYYSPSPLAGETGACPSPREGGSMAYDPVLGGAVLYGGTSWIGTPYQLAQGAMNGNNGYVNIPEDTTTWEFANGQWTKMAANAPNSGSAFDSMVYDPSLGGVVMGGGLYNWPDYSSGCNGATDRVAQYGFSTLSVFNSTSKQWTTVNSNTGNSPYTMYGVSMAYDPIDDTLVLEGGGHIDSVSGGFDSQCVYTLGSVDYYGDTWAWKGGQSGGWSDQQTSPDSSNNVLGEMVYDTASAQLLLISGWGGSSMNNWVDEWSGSSWTDTSSNFGPGSAGEQEGSATAYDGTDNYVVLVPGTSSANSETLAWPPPVSGTMSNYPTAVDAGASFGATLSISSPLVAQQGWGYILNWTSSGNTAGTCASSYVAGGGPTQVQVSCHAPDQSGTYQLVATLTLGGIQPAFGSQSTVTQSNTITVYPPLSASLATWPQSPPWVEVGNTIYLNASVTGGDQPYSYSWTNISTACTNIGNPAVADIKCLAAASGKYSVMVTVSDQAGGSTSASANIIVFAPLALSKPSWVNHDIDSGSPVTLAATITGGWPDVSTRVFNWSGLPTGCTNTDTGQLTCQPSAVSAPQYTNICFNVSDPSGGANVCGYSTIEPPLNVLSYYSNRTSVDGNQWVEFTAVVSGGTGSYSGTSWNIFDKNTGQGFACNGNHYTNSSQQSLISTGCQAPNVLSNQTAVADVVVADGSLNGDKTSSLTMPIYPDPYITQSNASAYSVYNNKTVYLFGAAAMGTGTYSYAWTGLPRGCASQNVPVLACAPNVTQWQYGGYYSMYNIDLWINDSNGYPASWPAGGDSQSVKHPIVLTVFKSPDIFIQNVPGTDVGQTVTFYLAYNGAFGKITSSSNVTWGTLPSGWACGTWTLTLGQYAAQSQCTVTSMGSYQVPVTVQTSRLNTTYAFLNVSSDPLVGALSAPSGQTVGQTATFTLSGASGGIYPYTFYWDLSAIGCANQTTGNRTLTVSCVPTVPGTNQVSVYAVDGNDVTSNIAGTFATFGSIPTITLTPAPGTTDSGLHTLFTATVSSGTFNYQWKLTPTASCTPSGSATFQNCTWSAPGTYFVNLTLMNTAGYVTSTNVSYNVLADPSAYLKESRTFIDLGQSVKYTVVSAGGLSPYTYSWLNLPFGCTSANLPVLTCQPTANGNFSVTSMVTDSLGLGVTTNYVNLTVVGGPSLSKPIPTRTSIDDGQGVNFTVFASNSSGNDVYSWSGLPVATCPVSSISTIYCSYLVAGTYHVIATVTDSNGLSAVSPVLPYTVLSDPTVKLAGPTGPVDASQPVLLTATASNGTGIYHYSWTTTSPMSCPNANSPKDVCTAGSAGTGGVTVVVSDSNGGTTSASMSVTANPALLVNVTAASTTSTMPLNQSTWLSGTFLSVEAGSPLWVNGSANGGAPPYHLSATVNGSIVKQNTNVSSLSSMTTLGKVGYYTVTFNVTDSVSTVSVQGVVEVVGVPMNVTLGIPVAINASEPANVTANVIGGIGPFSYFWAVQDGNFSNGNANETTSISSTAVSWSSSGNYNISVRVTDAQGVRAFSRSVVAVGKSPLVISWSAHSPVDQNASENVSVTVTGGTAPYTFSWYQQTGPSPANHRYWNTTVDHSFLTWFMMGTFNASVTVTDSHGASGTIAGVFVVGSGISVSCAPTESGSLTVGSVVTFSLPCSPHGGIPPYTYTWELISGSSPGGIPFVNGTGMTFNHTFQSAGSYLVIVRVQDSTHAGGVQAPTGSFHISATGGSGGLGSITGSLLFWAIMIPIAALLLFLLAAYLLNRRRRGTTPKQPTVSPEAAEAQLSPVQWAVLEHLEEHPLEEQERLTMAVGTSQGASPGEVLSAIGMLGPMGLLDSRQNVEDKETRYELTEPGKKMVAKRRAASSPPIPNVSSDAVGTSVGTVSQGPTTTSTPDTDASAPWLESEKDTQVTAPLSETPTADGHKALGEKRQATDEANPYKGKVKPEDVNPQLIGKRTIPAELLQPLELQQVKDRGTVERASPGGTGIDYDAKAKELEAKTRGEVPPQESKPKRGRLRDHLRRQNEGNGDGKS